MRRAWCLALIVLGGCAHPVAAPEHPLPTGVVLDPVGVSMPLGSMPLTMLFSPDSGRIVTVLCGYRAQGIEVIDPVSHRVAQTLVQPAAFVGACFSADGSRLFVSGGNRDVVYVYTWRADSAALSDSVRLGPAPGRAGGHVYPAGLQCSPDGRRLYVAANLADLLLVVDVATHRVVQRLATGRYPYDVAVRPDGRVFVSAWGGSWVASFRTRGRRLAPGPRIAVGPHPSSMRLDARGRLYVTCATNDRIAVVDTDRDSLADVLADSAPGGPTEGSTPNGLALSPDGRRLYVAEADNDAVAVFGRPDGAPGWQLLGRFPVEWYPTAVLARGDSLYVLNGKGSGTSPNPRRLQPGSRAARDPLQYTLGQTSGSLSFLASPGDAELPGLSQRVAVSNHWGHAPAPGALPTFQHVIYVVRENRTFDQVLGDLGTGDGDSSLTFFPRSVTPNAHALAERFGVFDRFFVNGEVSGDGHNWTMAAYASDYVEKTIPSNYSGRGRAYDYDGLNRDRPTDEDVNEPSSGYLWDLAQRAHVSLRNYGEFTRKTPRGGWIANKPWLATCTDTSYPGWDLDVPDSVRAERWIAAFRNQVAGDSMPALSILWLPNDHTAGGRSGSPTPRAYVADNDLALGRIVEALTHSRYWANTVMFVLEDDAQDGPDHVDSHRSLLLVISPYGRRGVLHRFANTTDVLATIDQVLRLGALSKFDFFGRPLDEAFTTAFDTSAYVALLPGVSRHETNADSSVAARLSRGLDLSREDRADMALFNRILWLVIKGPDAPYPGRRPQPHS
jgi:YVTN family beta-propeller protein